MYALQQCIKIIAGIVLSPRAVARLNFLVS